MKNDWVISVLLDLKEYARHNGLPRLADELDTARLIGLMEMEQSFDVKYVPVDDTLENYWRRMVEFMRRGDLKSK